MKNKLLIISLIVLLSLSATTFVSYLSSKTNVVKDDINVGVNNSKEENKIEKVTSKNLTKTSQGQKIIHKSNLFNDLSNNQVSLSLIANYKNYNNDVQKKIMEIIDSSDNIYLVKELKDKIVIVREMPSSEEFSRHDIEILTINPETNEIVKTNLDKFSSNNIDKENAWEYDKDTEKPTLHIKYNKNKAPEYAEYWNYDEDKDIKYEVKNDKNEILSVKKEVLENENMVQTHVFYNDNGEITKNIIVNYDGPNISRVTYYDSENPEVSAIIMNEYNNDNKTKETVYTSDYKILNTYTANYEDMTRKEVNVLDKDNKEILKIEAE